MLLPPVIRIFFAIDMSASVRDTLGQFIGQLKKTAKSNSIRWSKPENLHITLQFMQEVRSEHLTGIVRCVKEELKAMSSKPSFRFGATHFFPSAYRPRVIVLDILPQEPLAELSRHIGRGITAMQYDIENRPFRAHLTLGRIKHPDMNLDFVSKIKLPEMNEIAIEEVVLFRSEPQENGSHYTELERIAL